VVDLFWFSLVAWQIAPHRSLPARRIFIPKIFARDLSSYVT
jgi:hypothetical protein